jgi:hypothetical protein
VALSLTEKTVFCTDRGYGNIQLKVSVPDLDWLAHFDHRVASEGLPCITGGRCTSNLGPGDILDPNDRIAVVIVRVGLWETLRIDREKRTCERSLEERVKANIRGHEFNHARGANLGVVDFEQCERIAQQEQGQP